jgi:hypothetical protein
VEGEVRRFVVVAIGGLLPNKKLLQEKVVMTSLAGVAPGQSRETHNRQKEARTQT